MHYLLVGNYGAGNLGDEKLKGYFLRNFPDVEWHVVSANPKKGELPRFPAGLRSLFKPWWKTLWMLGKSDGIVFGGGSLFTDAESPMACLLWWWHSFIANVFHRRIFLAFQGIGPFRTRVGEWCARWVIARAAFVSVRDGFSYERIKSWRKSTKVIQTFDPIISLIEATKPECSSRKVLIVIPRKNSGASLYARVHVLSGCEQWDEVRVLSLQPGSTGEKRVCRELCEASQLPVEIIPVDSLEKLSDEVACGSLILAHRYHGVLAAIALGKNVEIVAQRDEDKLSSLQYLIRGGVEMESLLRLVRKGEEALREVMKE